MLKDPNEPSASKCVFAALHYQSFHNVMPQMRTCSRLALRLDQSSILVSQLVSE